MRRLLLPLLLVLVTGCTGQEPPSAPAPEPPAPTATASPVPMPRFVGPADDGTVFTMATGTTATLRITRSGAEPVVTGAAVLLVQMVPVTGTGAREWEIRAVEPGTSTVTGTEPPFTLTVVVR